MPLLAPKVIGPLSECSSAVRVKGQISGSTVEVFVGPNQVATGVASWADQTFPLTAGAALAPGDEVTATQTLGAEVSPRSPEPIQVQAQPPVVGHVGFRSRLFVCGQCLWVEGAVPGATVEVTAGGAVVGAASAPDGNARMGLAPPIGFGDVLEAHQTACGVAGPVTPGPAPVFLGEVVQPFPAPSVEPSLKACQRAAVVSDVFDGAQVTLDRTGGPSQVSCFDLDRLSFRLGTPLVEGESVTGRQELTACELVSPDSAPPVVVGPAEPVLPPFVVPPLCAGTTTVSLSGLIPGSKIRISQDGVEIGMAEASDDDLDHFSVDPPLAGGTAVTARQELCGIWSGPSNEVRVDPNPAALPQPVIPEPLFECAGAVRVMDAHPGARVYVVSALLGAPIGEVQALATVVDVPVAPQLIANDEVFAFQVGCGQRSPESPHVAVQPVGDLRPPSVQQPVDQCMRAVTVIDAVPGARVDVFADTIWRGSVVATTPSVLVPLAGRLHVGEQVTARQRLCAQISEFGRGARVIDRSRRDVATVSDAERALLLDAFLQLDTNPNFRYPDGVSFWDKQEDIHKDAHFAGADVHGGSAFIPWHRELVNRLEALLREVHPEVSLHYWDWQTDPTFAGVDANGVQRANLFTAQFMGGTGNPAGPPFQNFTSTEATDPQGDGVHDHIWRELAGAPTITPSDDTIRNAPDFVTFNSRLQEAHDQAHGYIGGTIGKPHFSFHDPFVFLLHSNTDRLWAEWQTMAGHPERLTPKTAYGDGIGVSDFSNLNEPIQPWAGGTPLEPWASDASVRSPKNYRDRSVIDPPCYFTVVDDDDE